MLDNVYIINYSRLQALFIIVHGSSRRVVACSNDFTGIYNKIKQLRDSGNIELSFTDSAIDEISKRNLTVEGVY